MAPKSLRIIHSGRLLTDGILLLPWLKSLEERVKRQTGGVGADVESVLKDVGLSDEVGGEEGDPGKRGGEVGRDGARVWLHCVVGSVIHKDDNENKEDEVGVCPFSTLSHGSARTSFSDHNRKSYVPTTSGKASDKLPCATNRTLLTTAFCTAKKRFRRSVGCWVERGRCSRDEKTILRE